MQERVLHAAIFNDATEIEKAFHIFKQALLNQPFTLSGKTPLVRKLFDEVLLWQTHENLFKEGSQHSETVVIESVSSLTDIFIYYASHLEDQALFAFLWLNYLKIMLHFAEEADSKDIEGIMLAVREHLKRVIELLITAETLKESDAKLWKTTWEIVGAFYKNLKAEILDKKGESKQ